jgi:cellulose synthase/poly-beta-1,6-N-acetylglucosamine synthase-like glycosyltransferase
MSNKQPLFQLCFTTFSQKIYTSNVIILKNEKIFSKMIFFKESLKNIPKGVRSIKMSSCNLT